MGRTRYITSGLVLDASPLVYLAKLDALDVLAGASEASVVTPTVLDEVTRPQLAYRHPDAVEIERAVNDGLITVVALGEEEQTIAVDFADRVPGLHRGEAEVLSLAVSKSMPAVIFERQARRVARTLGAELIDVVELIVAGTADQGRTEDRIVRFARMVNMRFDHVAELLSRLGSSRLM